MHAHQATSTLANESVVYAAVLGLPAVYTDHSLFGLHDTAGVILNRVLTTTLATVNAVICVSRACRDNLILRAKVPPDRVVVIPNAVQAAQFQPPPPPPSTSSSRQYSNKPTRRLTVAVVSRLAYRKGVDLLIGIIPIICRQHKHVGFLIGGDGPQRLAIHEMVEVNRLEDRVQILGAVPHAKVRDHVLQHGQIFLNCSLTESFCIAILEAACVGLTVVSTNVGGIPEVLDATDDDVRLADPTVPAMVKALDTAIREYDMKKGYRDGKVKDPWQRHYALASKYNWSAVAQQTVQVYDTVRCAPSPSLLARLACYVQVHGNGPTAWVVVILAVTMEVYTLFVAWLQPEHTIDVVPEDGMSSS
jgi:phosphatidylinositol glycan class A protein